MPPGCLGGGVWVSVWAVGRQAIEIVNMLQIRNTLRSKVLLAVCVCDFEKPCTLNNHGVTPLPTQNTVNVLSYEPYSWPTSKDSCSSHARHRAQLWAMGYG